MNGSERWAALRNGFGAGYGILAITAVVFASVGSLPIVVGAAAALGGATLASALRSVVPPRWGYLGLLPALVSLGTLAVYCPIGVVPELLGGLAGLGLLLWCAEDPTRRSGAVSRGISGLFVPAAAFGIAWLSSLLLPSGLGSVGIAAALLAASATAIIILLRAPGTFDRDPAATS